MFVLLYPLTVEEKSVTSKEYGTSNLLKSLSTVWNSNVCFKVAMTLNHIVLKDENTSVMLCNHKIILDDYQLGFTNLELATKGITFLSFTSLSKLFALVSWNNFNWFCFYKTDKMLQLF